MSKLLNVDDITRGAIAVLCSQVLPKEEEGLTTIQAANALGVSVTHLNLMRHTKTGPVFYRDGNRVLYKPSSVRDFISQTNAKARKNRRVA